jgi:ATP/maltotriose-dependent transcriptional regulator MalT
MRPRGFVYGIVLALTGFGRIAAAKGMRSEAVQLFTAAAAELERVNGVMPLYMRQRHDEGLARARAALGEEPPPLGLDEAIRLAERVAAGAAADGALSAREREVLGLVAERLSNQEIAERLVVSVRTVHAHLRSIYRKLGVGSRTDAVEQGLELGLLARK